MYLASLVAGLGAGAVYALMGLGLVLTSRGVGVINFGFGALATWCAYVFYDLRVNARYPLAIPGPWRDISFGENAEMTFLSALVLTLMTAVIISALAFILVFRILRRAPVLAKVVASVGILLVLQGMIGIRFNSASINLDKVLPSGVIRVSDQVLVAVDAVWLLAVTVVVALALWGVSRFSRFGLAVRAAAESEKGAVLLGFAPDNLALVTWIVAGVIAGLVGIVATPLFELTPMLFTQLMVPALGAALIGRFVSFGWTVVAGVGIGMLQALLSPLQQNFSWIPRTGMRDGFVFLLIVVAMVVLGKRLPTRGSIDIGRLPPVAPSRSHPATTLIVVGAVVLGFIVIPDAWGLSLLTSVMFTGLALSLVVLTGFMGQISLAQMAIAGIAGFSLSRFADRLSMPFPVAPLLAAFVATFFGIVVGIPALRVRGVNLAIVTLAGSVAIQEFVFKNRSFVGDVSTGGARIPNPEIFGIDLGLRNSDDPYRPVFGIFVTLCVALLAILVVNVRRSATGRHMLAVRSNERAAAATGINTSATKLIAFGLSSFIAGVMGTLFAYRFGSISDSSFGFFASLTVLAFAYLGGITGVAGALLAGVVAADGIGFRILDGMWERLGVDFGRWQIMVGALGLTITAIQNPDGIAGALGRSRDKRREAKSIRAA